MRRFLVPGVVSLMAIALLLVLAFGVAAQGTSSSIDSEVASGHYPVAPDLRQSLPRLDAAGKLSLADLHGKVVLLNVFASWCVPCAQEASVLEQAEHMLRAHGGTVLGVTYLDNSVDSLAFMRQHHITYPVVHDVTGSFVRSFGTTGVPESFVINRSGRIQALQRFQLNTAWIKRTLPKIMGAAS